MSKALGVRVPLPPPLLKGIVEMDHGELFEQAMKRPKNFHNLSEEEHWKIDRQLGILDWDGSCLHKNDGACPKCEERYWETHDRRND